MYLLYINETSILIKYIVHQLLVKMMMKFYKNINNNNIKAYKYHDVLCSLSLP